MTFGGSREEGVCVGSVWEKTEQYIHFSATAVLLFLVCCFLKYIESKIYKSD